MNVLVITMLAKFPQGRTVGFATPGVPITPILGIAINFYLMLRLSPLTLIRFTVWMVLGKKYSHIRVSQQVWNTLCEQSEHRLQKKLYYAPKNCLFSLFCELQEMIMDF